MSIDQSPADSAQEHRRQPDTEGPQSSPVSETTGGLGEGFAQALGVLAHTVPGSRGNGPARAAAVQRMQQTHGNRATQQFLQRQSAAAPAAGSAPGDKTVAAPPAAAAPPTPIHIAIALQPTQADIAHAAAGYLNKDLRTLLQHTATMLGATSQWKRLQADIGEGTRLATQDDATALGTAAYANNLEFGRQATDHARARQSVGGAPGALQVGRHIPFEHGTNPVTQIQAISRDVAEHGLPVAPGASTAPAATPPAPATTPAPATPAPTTATPAPTAPGNITELAVFTHGIAQAMDLGSLGWVGAARLEGPLQAYLAPSVAVQLYGCTAAAGANSFAEQFATALAHDHHDARVFGHTVAGHTTTNSQGREFVAQADQTDPAAAHTNYQAVFAADYIQTETARLVTALGATAEDVTRVLPQTSQRWLLATWPRLHGPGGGLAAYTMGFDRDGTVQAIHAVWEQEGEGAAAVRRALAVARRTAVPH
ncbi:MAG: hypothetical protein M3Z04_01665 [Chloroflexota bacterium]|nr:hypothetical protein [Chloroflexota bacterium]